MLQTDLFHIRTGTAERISQERMLERICVRPPYFALTDMRWIHDTLEAVVTAETPLGMESGPIFGAELSRHAAIAGLCAAALAQQDDKRRYYLAQEADYEGFWCHAPYGTPIVLRAEVQHLDKREARARISATCQGQLLARLDVRYTILTEPAFERLFRTRYQPDLPAPGVLSELPEGHTAWEGDTLVRRIASVPAAACAGHFDHYPAMPVAILMGQLSQIAGSCLDGARYIVTRASVNANDLCWAGESVDFMVRPTLKSDSFSSFECSALSSGRPTGSMHLTLQREERI